MLIYTDGSSSGRMGAGPGGWAFVVYDTLPYSQEPGALLHEAYGGARLTTNNRMEMLAIVRALIWVGDRQCVIHSDSQLCINTLTQWGRTWQRNGWTKRTGVIANLDIVRPAFELFQTRPRVTLKWVRGHNGNVGNERADVLAGMGRAEIKSATPQVGVTA